MGKRGIILGLAALCAAFATAMPHDASAQANRKAPQTAARKRKVTKAEAQVDTLASVNNALASTANTALASDPGAATTVPATAAMTLEEQENDLYDRLHACVQSKCEGEVAWEKCFGGGKAKGMIMSDPTCKTYYDNSNASVRTNALTRLDNMINDPTSGYFVQACKGISDSAKIVNGACKVPVFYRAQDGKGKSHDLGSMTTTPGRTFMCSYVTFGIDSKKLEWKEDKWEDAQYVGNFINGVTTSVNAGITLLTSGINIYQQTQKEKQLAGVEGTKVYIFNGTGLTEIAECEKAVSKNKTVAQAEGCGAFQDSSGNWYCMEPGKDAGSFWCTGTGTTPVEYEDIRSCGSINTFKIKSENTNQFNLFINMADNGAPHQCYEKIAKVSKTSVANKTTELIKRFGLLDSTASAAASAAQTQQYMNYAVQSQVASSLTNIGGTGGNSGVPAAQTQCLCSMNFEGVSELHVENTSGKTAIPNSCSYIGSSATPGKYVYTCMEQNCASQRKCTGSGKNWYEPSTPSGVGGAPQESNPYNFVDTNGNLDSKVVAKMQSDSMNKAMNNMAPVLGAIQVSQLTSGMAQDSIQQASAVKGGYTSAQSSINEHNAAVQAAADSKQASINTIISDGGKDILSAVTTFVGNDMAYKAKSNMMTGYCFIGDAAKGNGQNFAIEGQSRKLGWIN